MSPLANLEIKALLLTDSTGQQHAVPFVPTPLAKGTVVHYSSPDGDVRIEFVGDPTNNTKPLTPFLDSNGSPKTAITNADPPMELSQTGDFFCRCFITPKGKQTIGWGPNSPLSGGNHKVT